MNKFLPLLFLAFFSLAAQAAKIKGHVYDQQTGEPLVGATVYLQDSKKATVTGLDGSFELKDVSYGAHTIRITYISYITYTQQLDVQKNEDIHSLKIYLKPEGKSLNEVAITSKKDGSAEKEARRLEQRSDQVLNVVSGRAIEVSPDLTVANVIQRVSGVSVERNSNGDAQYAILRGMDKRYNYTLVNGVKIPSPDNQYRYVPLDLFPSDLLDRLEVYKTLTPNMEGDAVGGAVNMVMKDAPSRFQFNANLATGYNQLFFDRKFTGYDNGAINHKSPYEVNGRLYQANQNDFPKATLAYNIKNPAPNLVGSFSLGQRFLNNKLGFIVAGSYQNTYRGSNSTLYSSAVAGTDQYAVVTSKSYREYSEQQKRYGLHAKADYVFNSKHKLSFYNMYVNLNNIQVRDAVNTNYSTGYDPTNGNAELSYATRSRYTQQQIYNSTLHGDHKFFDDRFKVQWSAVYASAKNDVPDNTTISLSGVRKNNVDSKTVVQNATHRWERNTDEDKAGYLDLSYALLTGDTKLDVMAGGLYRDKQRSSFYNNYILYPVNTAAKYGVDFQNYTDVAFTVQNPTGAVNNPLTYDASEKTTSGYGMFKLATEKWQATGGVRVEHTDQGYNLLFPAGELRPKGSQVYTDVLPSLTVKYLLSSKQQFHASYYRALNRPGFYEIVPSKVVNEDYVERGNPDLKRALADNIDFRYELFPNASEQFLAGVFYKAIQNPIEFTFQADAVRGQDVFYTPGNFGTAHNYGLELDYIKFFNKFGVKANYTYTHSRITTNKTSRQFNSATNQVEPLNVEQSRPLYGQSEHVGNVSLLYKDTKKGWDAQLAAAYTGERINTVSQFLNNDLWQKAFIQMDASAEKHFKNGLSIFVKGGNLLNTPLKLFIKGTNPENNKIMENLVSGNQTLIRNDFYKQSYLIGVRYKL